MGGLRKGDGAMIRSLLEALIALAVFGAGYLAGVMTVLRDTDELTQDERRLLAAYRITRR
jgi:Tfp pilus assembly protein PilV